MGAVMPRVIALLLFVLGGSPVAAQEPPFDFKGIALGSDVSSLERSGRFLCKEPRVPIADWACMLKFSERETIAGVPIGTLILYYYSGTLEMIFVTFASKHFSAVVGALTEKYGEATVKNYRIGAAFENRTHSWHRGNARLEAQLYAGNVVDHSSVMYRTDFAIQEFARRRPFIGQGKGEGFVADGTAYRFEYERRLSGEAQSRPLPSHGLSELWIDPKIVFRLSNRN